MIRINVKAVLNEESERAPMPPPSSQIKINRSPLNHEINKAGRFAKDNSRPVAEACWNEFNELKIQRGKLSSQIWLLVANCASTEVLKVQYEKIEGMSTELTSLFEQARFAEKHGRAPVSAKPDRNITEIFALKDERRKLIDLRSKLHKKITVGKAKNPNKVIEWQLELEQADAAYILVDEKIKKAEGKIWKTT